MSEYRLGSTSMVHAPGLIDWAIHGYQTGTAKDKLMMIEVLSSWKTVPALAILSLLKGDITHTVIDEAVVIEVDDE